MKKAVKMRRIWLTVGILTSVSAVAAVPVIVLSALSRSYVLMAFAIAVCAHGFYGVTFYFLAFAGAGDKLRCVRAVEESGLRTYTAISVAVMMTEDAVKNTLAKCIKGGYLEGLVMGAFGLEPLRSEIAEVEVFRCEYCGTVLSAGEEECPSCGAKIN